MYFSKKFGFLFSVFWNSKLFILHNFVFGLEEGFENRTDICQLCCITHFWRILVHPEKDPMKCDEMRWEDD